MSSIKNVFETVRPKSEAKDVLRRLKPGYSINAAGHFTVPLVRERSQHIYIDPDAKNADRSLSSARFAAISQATI